MVLKLSAGLFLGAESSEELHLTSFKLQWCCVVCKTTVFVQQGVCAPLLTSSLPAIISNPGKTFPHKIQCWADKGVLQDFQKSLVITGRASVKSCVAGGFPCLKREQRCALGEEESFRGNVLMNLNLSRRQERDPGPGCLLGGHKKLLGIWHTWFFPAAGLHG